MPAVKRIAVFTILFALTTVCCIAQSPFRGLGKAHEFAQEDFVEQTVWLPYWAERDSHHSTLHVRNVMLHTPLDVRVEIMDVSGKVVGSATAALAAADNGDFDVAELIGAALPEDQRTGGAKVSFSYPIAGVVQAEISVLDNKRNHAYTIVGRPVSPGESHAAFLAFRYPTADTYLELAFLNPLAETVDARIEILGGNGWQPVADFQMPSSHMHKLRVQAQTLASSRTSADKTVLIRATFSKSATEILANAWLEDETIGYSNTVLFHDAAPNSSMLYGSQLVAHAYPQSLLANGPDFRGYLVLANVDESPKSVTARLYCEVAGEVRLLEIPARSLAAFDTQLIELNELVAGVLGKADGTLCSAEVEFDGKPGILLGRYFGESTSLTYGLYSKLEPNAGRAYNELYWNVSEDRTPVLSVTNLSAEEDVVEIFATRGEDTKSIRKLPLAGHATIHVNLR